MRRGGGTESKPDIPAALHRLGARQRQQQIPFGNDHKKGKGKGNGRFARDDNKGAQERQGG